MSQRIQALSLVVVLVLAYISVNVYDLLARASSSWAAKAIWSNTN